jgi:aminoglycoside phosphotransferase (APT) family kinase protein
MCDAGDVAPAGGLAASEAAVLAALARALGADVRAGRLRLARRPQRHSRSVIYFVGIGRLRRRRTKWVVKRPDVSSGQQDLSAPASAETEFASLVRLAQHFSPLEPRLRVPRPVALLPEIGAFAMEAIQGRDISALVQAGTLVDTRRLLAAVAEAAEFLRHLHWIEPPSEQVVDLRAQADALLEYGDLVLARYGLALPDELAQTLRAVPGRRVRARICRLHGDFAPVNILIDKKGNAVGIDVALDRMGLPEHDLARFLVMLGSERLFIAGDHLASVRAVRRRAEATLLRTYYGEAGPPLLLELQLIEGLCRRWIRRHVTRLENRPSLRGARRRMVDAHFRRLLDESAVRIRRTI